MLVFNHTDALLLNQLKSWKDKNREHSSFANHLGTLSPKTVCVNYDSNPFQYALVLGKYSKLNEDWILR